MFNIRGKCCQHSHWMLVWVSSMLDPKHPLSGADPESNYIATHGFHPKGEGDCGYLHSITSLTPGRWGSLALVGHPRRRGNSDNKPMGRRYSSALVGKSPRRGKMNSNQWPKSLCQLARPWQLNILLFYV